MREREIFRKPRVRAQCAQCMPYTAHIYSTLRLFYELRDLRLVCASNERANDNGISKLPSRPREEVCAAVRGSHSAGLGRARLADVPQEVRHKNYHNYDGKMNFAWELLS